MQIFDIQPFLNSSLFQRQHYTYNQEKRVIIKRY